MNKDIDFLYSPEYHNAFESYSSEAFLPESITSIIPRFIVSMKVGFSNILNIFSKPEYIPSLFKIKNDVLKLTFIDLANSQIFIPPGLNVQYLQYIDALDDSMIVIENIEKGVLNPFARWLGESISDPEKLSKFRSGMVIADFKPSGTAALSKRLGSCFTMGATKNKGEFKNYIKRVNDIPIIYTKASAIIDRVNKMEFKKLGKKINEVVSKLNSVEQIINNAEGEEVLSYQNREIIAKLCVAVAEELEFMGVVCYQLTVLANALRENYDILAAK